MEYRNSWIEFYLHKTNFNIRYELAGYFDTRHLISISFLFFSLYLHLPLHSQYDECDPPGYGISYFGRTLWWHWNREFYTLHMPWDYDWIRTSNLREDGNWEHETRGDSKDFYDDKWKYIIWSKTYPYVYVLNNGTIQKRNATVKVEEREWRQKWLRWTPLFSKIRKTIDVTFDGEVGERTGTWKGGTIGCGYDLRKGESPLDCLIRMEKDRKF